GRAPATSWWKGTQALEIVVEPQVEVDALHLAVGEEVGPGPELVVDGKADGIANGFLAVVGAEQLRLAGGLVTEPGVPARERPAADHRRREQRERRQDVLLKPRRRRGRVHSA